MINQGWKLTTDSKRLLKWKWYKPPIGGYIKLSIVSILPRWYKGHFISGRMIKCEGSNCKYCNDGLEGQIRYLFAVKPTEGGIQGILEVGETVAMLIKKKADEVGFLKGLQIKVTKYGTRKNSPINIELLDILPDEEATKETELDLREAISLTLSNNELHLRNKFSATTEYSRLMEQQKIKDQQLEIIERVRRTRKAND